MTMQRSNIIVGSFILTVSFLLFLVTFTFEGRQLGRIFPQVILILMMVFSAVLILKELIKRTRSQGEARSSVIPMTTLFAMGVAFVYIFASFIVGFYVTTALTLTVLPFTLGYLMKTEGEAQEIRGRWSVALMRYFLIAFGFCLIVYLSFTSILKIHFPDGLLM
ncbi:MAG: tripartite tricarboxylate transporter TctB family protein [Nitrospirae bacterium]|nr:tripartite tricarboxylate transporter TctB family protein [Nitrospirota bacterium]